LDPLPRHIYDKTSAQYGQRNSTEVDLGQLVDTIGFEIISVINGRSYLNLETSRNYLCKKIHLNFIDSAIWNTISSNKIIIKLSLRIKESEPADINGLVMITPEYDSEKPHGEANNYTPFPVVYQGNKLFAKPILIYRNDVYAGTCEDAARTLHINPEFCFCNEEVYEEILGKEYMSEPE
jgi:hypothetical protein